MSANDIDLKALERDLQKLGTQPRGWFSRNWKWATPLLLLLLAVGGAGGYAWWYFGTVTGNESYQRAMKTMAAHPAIQESLGDSIQLLYYPVPSINNDGDNTDFRWEILGSNGKKAKAHLKTRLMSGKWETVLVEVELPEGKKISLNDDEGGNVAQPFVAPVTPDPNAVLPTKPTEEAAPDFISPNIPMPDESK